MNYVAEGYNSFDTKKAPTGTVKYLPDPKSVIALIQSGKLKEHILLVRAARPRSLRRPSDGRDRRDHDVRGPRVPPRHPVARISDPLRDDRLSDQAVLALRGRRRRRRAFRRNRQGSSRARRCTLNCSDREIGQVIAHRLSRRPQPIDDHIGSMRTNGNADLSEAL